MKINLITIMKEKQFNLSDSMYAKSLGIPKVQMEGWYSGKTIPTAHSAFKVCTALGLTDKNTTAVINQLDTVRARKRRATIRNTATTAQIDEYKELAENFVRAGRIRGLTITELVEETGFGSRVTLNRYRSGERIPKVKTRNIMKQFIEETATDLTANRVPKETPEDHSLLAEYVWQISKYNGQSLEDLLEELNVGSESTIWSWRKGKMNPRFDALNNLIEYVDAFNETLPVERRNDPYDLIPPRPKSERIRIKDYDTLHKIEFIYGSVTKVPDNHPLLTQLQQEWGIV